MSRSYLRSIFGIKEFVSWLQALTAETADRLLGARKDPVTHLQYLIDGAH